MYAKRRKIVLLVCLSLFLLFGCGRDTKTNNTDEAEQIESSTNNIEEVETTLEQESVGETKEQVMQENIDTEIFLHILSLYTEDVPLKVFVDCFENNDIGAFVLTITKEEFVRDYALANGETIEEIEENFEERVASFVVTEEAVAVVSEYFDNADCLHAKVWYVTETSCEFVCEDEIIWVQTDILADNIKCFNVATWESMYNNWNTFFCVAKGNPHEILRVRCADVLSDGTVQSTHNQKMGEPVTGIYWETTKEIWKYEAGEFVCVESHTYTEY